MFSLSYRLYIRIQQKQDVFRYFCSKSPKSKLHKPISTQNKKSYGQPTSESHPFLLKDGEVTPGISRREYQDRRQKLVEEIVTYSSKNSKKASTYLIVIPSATKQYMSDKIPYIFRQNSDFLYLSGCLEPDSCLVLAANDSPSQHCATLFMREKDEHAETWDGPRTGPEEAINLFGVDQALSTDELVNFFNCYMKTPQSTSIWYDVVNPVQPKVHEILSGFFKTTENKCWESPKPFVHRLRVIKSPAEQVLMQKSCDIASEAIIKTVTSSKPGISEHQIFAKMDYECRMNGAEMLAYPPVVAGGNRATTIHYINNNQLVSSGDMVLMDAGCEYHGYSSDITRTWPINGKFNQVQRCIYEAVLDVQKDLIKMLENFPSLDKLFDYMCLLLGQRLQEVGLISKNADTNYIIRTSFQFCPHHVSHYLGMDVHDTPTVPRSIKVVPGMVVTVEPGLYFHKNLRVPKEFRGLGVRIEDDVLITENGPVVLTR
ncbi:Peptidase, partial [Oryctes borbonicus]